MKIRLALSVLSLALTGLYVFDATYVQWSRGYGWASILNPHGGWFYLLLLASWPLSAVLCISVVAEWKRSVRGVGRPTAFYLIWSVLLFLSTLSILPSSSQYAGAAVLLMGPGNNGAYLQRKAARHDSEFLLRALILRSATISGELIALAASSHSVGVVDVLIRAGMDVNNQELSSRNTALHIAVAERQYAIVEALLAAGARKDLRNAKGKSPLDLAREQDDQRLMKILNGMGPGAASHLVTTTAIVPSGERIVVSSGAQPLIC